MAVTRDEYEFIARFRTEALEAARQAQDALQGMGDGAGYAADEAMSAAQTMKEVAKVTAQVTGAFVTARKTFQFVRESLNEFADLETRMTAIAKVSTLTEAELDQLGTSFEGLAADMGLSIDMFTDAATVAGQLGVDGVANIETFTDAMVKLAGASDLAGQEGATTIARILNITGEGVQNAGRFASVMVELGNNVAATESEIASLAGEVSRATASFKTTSTFAAGMGAAMAELGLRAETAGTAVGRVFTEMTLAMATGADEAAIYADAMGLTTEAFNQLVQSSPTDAFMLFLEGLNGMGETEALRVLDDLKLANAETVKSLTPLITNYERFTDVLAMANAEAANPDALNNEAMAAAATLARDYAGLIEMVRNELRSLGETWAPVASALIDGAKTLLTLFDSLPEGLQTFLQIAGTLAPAILAVKLAVAGVVGAMGLLLPATVTQTAAAGALSASLLGLGRAGQVAGAGLAVARMGIGAVLGPLGLIAAVAGVAAFALSDTEGSADELGVTLADAQRAMDDYANASKRAAEEQKGLRDGVTDATQAILDQSRAQLQQIADQLQNQIGGALQMEIDDADAQKVLGQISASMEELELRAEIEPDEEGYQRALSLLANLKDGSITFDTFRDSFERMASVGSEALDLVLRYRNDFNATAVDAAGKKALADLLRYAQATGKFGDEVDHIRKMMESGDESAMLLAVADLAAEMERTAKVGDALRDILPQSFIDAIREAGDAEVQLAAVKAQLQGNSELAQRILDTGNPFAELEEGAKDAADAVSGLTANMQAAYAQYYKSREMSMTPSQFGLDAITGLAGIDNGQQAAVELLRQFEDFRADVYPDMTYRDGKLVNSGYRTGYGSDTVTDEQGRPSDVVQGMTTTVEAALRDLRRRVDIYQGEIVDRIGADRFEVFTPAQQAALTSIAYNYGSLPDRIIGAVRDGSNVEISDAILSLQGDNNGINADRRRTEAAAFGRNVGVAEAEQRADDAYARTLEEQIQAQKDAVKAREDFIAANAEALDQAQFEATLAGKNAGEQARLRTEYELINQARREGIDIDKEVAASGRTYRQEIEETARQVGELATKEELRQTALERATERQAFFNQLQEDTQQGIIDTILEGESLVDVLGNLARAFANAALQAALFGDGPLSSGGSGLLGGLMDGVFSALGAGGSGVSPTKVSAKGNVFYQSATIPLAKGNALFAEAGPEAIMPLERMGDGTLGVRSIGGGGDTGGINVTYAPTFHIDAKGGMQQSGGSSNAGGYERLMKSLDAEVRAKVLEVLGRELQNGGILNPAAKPYG